MPVRWVVGGHGVGRGGCAPQHVHPSAARRRRLRQDSGEGCMHVLMHGYNEALGNEGFSLLNIAH